MGLQWVLQHDTNESKPNRQDAMSGLLVSVVYRLSCLRCAWRNLAVYVCDTVDGVVSVVRRTLPVLQCAVRDGMKTLRDGAAAIQESVRNGTGELVRESRGLVLRRTRTLMARLPTREQVTCVAFNGVYALFRIGYDAGFERTFHVCVSFHSLISWWWTHPTLFPVLCHAFYYSRGTNPLLALSWF